MIDELGFFFRSLRSLISLLDQFWGMAYYCWMGLMEGIYWGFKKKGENVCMEDIRVDLE